MACKSTIDKGKWQHFRKRGMVAFECYAEQPSSDGGDSKTVVDGAASPFSSASRSTSDLGLAPSAVSMDTFAGDRERANSKDNFMLITPLSFNSQTQFAVPNGHGPMTNPRKGFRTRTGDAAEPLRPRRAQSSAPAPRGGKEATEEDDRNLQAALEMSRAEVKGPSRRIDPAQAMRAQHLKAHSVAPSGIVSGGSLRAELERGNHVMPSSTASIPMDKITEGSHDASFRHSAENRLRNSDSTSFTGSLDSDDDRIHGGRLISVDGPPSRAMTIGIGGTNIFQ